MITRFTPKFTPRINKKTHRINIDADTPLLLVLRDELGYTGTKYGCGRGSCGACTVHVDCDATRSCMTAVDIVNVAALTTIV